jgi:CDP-diacylglycerol---glycerol-3-phosphate 3-phosphatidyltransferase
VNLPNRLTLARILLVPLILLFLLPLPAAAPFAAWNRFIGQYGQLIAFFLFAAAALTDLFDGKIARRRNLITNLGKFLDPIADKMLVIAVLIALVQLGRLNALIAIIVIIREFTVTGIRLAASDKGVVIAASKLGKAKTVSQIIAVLIMLGEKTLIWLTGAFLAPEWITGAGDLAMLVSLLLTVVSGYDYVRKNLSYLKE